MGSQIKYILKIQDEKNPCKNIQKRAGQKITSDKTVLESSKTEFNVKEILLMPKK